MLTGTLQYGLLYIMKATMDIPDELYRQVKAKSALEGRCVREIAVTLFGDSHTLTEVLIHGPEFKFVHN